MSLVYEVTLPVDADIAPATQQWLGEHIQQMFALPALHRRATDPGR